MESDSTDVNKNEEVNDKEVIPKENIPEKQIPPEVIQYLKDPQKMQQVSMALGVKIIQDSDAISEAVAKHMDRDLLETFAHHLDGADKRRFTFSTRAQWFRFFVFLISVCAIFGVLYLFKSDSDTLRIILIIFASFFGGFGAGYGVGKKGDK